MRGLSSWGARGLAKRFKEVGFYKIKVISIGAQIESNLSHWAPSASWFVDNVNKYTRGDDIAGGYPKDPGDPPPYNPRPHLIPGTKLMRRAVPQMVHGLALPKENVAVFRLMLMMHTQIMEQYRYAWIWNNPWKYEEGKYRYEGYRDKLVYRPDELQFYRLRDQVIAARERLSSFNRIRLSPREG